MARTHFIQERSSRSDRAITINGATSRYECVRRLDYEEEQINRPEYPLPFSTHRASATRLEVTDRETGELITYQVIKL